MIATWASVVASLVTAIATITLAWVGWAAYRLSKRLVEATQSQAVANQRLAEETSKIIEQNRDLLSATVREAEAVERQAQSALDLVGESQRDRELAHRPYLAISVEQVSAGTGRFTMDAYFVRNLGRGLALNCRMAHHDFSGSPPEHHSWTTPLFDLGPEEARQMEVSKGTWYSNVLSGLDYDTSTVDACCCEDQFGSKFRCARGFETGRNPQDKWHPGELEPGWAGWYKERTTPADSEE